MDKQLEAILGDFETLRLLLEASTREAGSRASPSAQELQRQHRHLAVRRQRLLDAYEAGELSLEELQKRTATLADERAAVQALMDAGEDFEVPEGFVDDLVAVFGAWRDLRRQEKRALLRDYRAEIVVEYQGKRKKSWLRVDRFRLGLFPSHLWLYKKMRRYKIT